VTRIVIWRGARGRITAYAAMGHAGYADEGADIVCAGISALTQSTVNVLEAIAHVTPRVIQCKGLLWVRIPRSTKSRQHDAQVLLKALELSIMELAKGYPEHIRLEWKGGYKGDNP